MLETINNPNYEKLKSDINSNDPVVREMASKQLRSLADSATPYNMFRDIMRKYGTEKNGKLQITNTDIDYAVNDKFNNFAFEAVDPNRNKVINALKGGKFNNMILLNNDNMITIPVVKNG